MHLEDFAEGNSLLHKIDPRIKFITIVPYIFLIALVKDITLSFITLLISILMTLFARLDFKKLLERFFAVNIFIFFLWMFIPFSFQGEEIFQIVSLKATKEGIFYALLITLKANAITLTTIAALGTSEVFSLAHALVHLRIPKKLIYLFFFFYRYITVLHEEYIRLKNAMKIRGFKAKTNIYTYKIYGYLIGMLFVRSYERSERIYNAMLCRGFNGNFSIVSHFKINKNDIIFGVVMGIITFLMAFYIIANRIF